MLVVGDSLEELTSPYLQRYLPGVQLTVNAVGGSNSYQIFDLFEESYDPSQSVIVFDARHQRQPRLSADPRRQPAEGDAKSIGDRCMVVPTIHGYTVNGIDNTGKNRVVQRIRRLEARHPDARLGGRRRRPPGAVAVRRPPPDPRRSRPAGAADRAGDRELPRGRSLGDAVARSRKRGRGPNSRPSRASSAARPSWSKRSASACSSGSPPE